MSVDADRSVTAIFGAGPDTVAPSAPAVTVAPRRYSFVVSCAAAADDHWLGGYDVFLDGRLVQRVPGSTVATRVDAKCDSSHTIGVAAFDAADNRAESSVDARTEPCLQTPPDTLLRRHPARVTSSRRAVFAFEATKAHSGFECRLDRHAWSRCRSPRAYRRLAVGSHVFRVRARDVEGLADTTPAVWRWRIAG